ncbi:Hypothetical protein MVR_LOCUS42 [uncultured virus]|nr:Hypothetical protein MVR_LOCUS42 [uncultured virus]
MHKVRVKSGLFDEEDYLKDCPKGQFIPATLPAVHRIIAIGDIHGDLGLAIRSFKLARLIDDDFNWIADPPNTVVVQVGDQVDSCRPTDDKQCHTTYYEGDKPNDLKVLDFFEDIGHKAQQQGGAVYSLLGNHELMNAQGRFGYVSFMNWQHFHYTDPDTQQVYEGPAGRREAFKPGGPLAKRLGCGRPTVLVIGSTMFVHAGLLPVLAERLDYIGFDSNVKLHYLNALVRKWLLHKLGSDSNDLEAKRMVIDAPSSSSTTISPFWTRIFGQIPAGSNINDGKCADAVKKTLEVYKIGKLVVGHTPQLFTHNAGINGTCYMVDSSNPTLFRVDAGFAEAFSSFGKPHPIQVLEIIDDRQFNILTEGVHPVLV